MVINNLINPILSIVTVTRNDSRGLEDTYRSLKAQAIDDMNSKRVEWLIIDGASNDDTIKVISNINLPISYYFSSEPDDGIFDAMNKGLLLCNGRYILFLNSGDRLSSQFTVDSLLKLINFSDKLIIAGRVRLHWGACSYISDLSPWVCHQSVLTSKSILLKYKFDKSKKYYGDLHLWMRLKRDGLFDVKRSDLVISDFDLGGVGNRPEQLWDRLLERNQLSREFEMGSRRLYRAFYTVLLIIVWRIFGKNLYYKFSSAVGSFTFKK